MIGAEVEAKKKLKTEGLPEVFYERNVKTWEFTVSPKNRGTEVAVAYDPESDLVHFFCRGKHEKRYRMSIEGEMVECPPFEGTVSIDAGEFGELYMTAFGLTDRTQDLGIDKNVTLRLFYRRDYHALKVFFSDYEKKQRTVFLLTGKKLLHLQMILEMIKHNLLFVSFVHTEFNAEVLTELDRAGNQLVITAEDKKLTFSLPESQFLKRIFENAVFSQADVDFSLRGLKVKSNGNVVVFDKELSKKVKIIFFGEEQKVKAYSFKLWKLLS